MYFTLCIFSAGLLTEEPFAMLSGKHHTDLASTLPFSSPVLNRRPRAFAQARGQLLARDHLLVVPLEQC